MNEYREEIIERRGATLYAHTNVANGTFGHEVLQMKAEGLLTETVIQGATSNDTLWKYTPADPSNPVWTR